MKLLTLFFLWLLLSLSVDMRMIHFYKTSSFARLLRLPPPISDWLMLGLTINPVTTVWGQAQANIQVVAEVTGDIAVHWPGRERNNGSRLFGIDYIPDPPLWIVSEIFAFFFFIIIIIVIIRDDSSRGGGEWTLLLIYLKTVILMALKVKLWVLLRRKGGNKRVTWWRNGNKSILLNINRSLQSLKPAYLLKR